VRRAVNAFVFVRLACRLRRRQASEASATCADILHKPIATLVHSHIATLVH
jgi:hypothetical protein